MAVEAQTALIQTGDRLPVVPDKIYDLGVEFIGFEDLSLVRVPLLDTEDLKVLIPGFNPDTEYQAEEATCVKEAGKAVIAIIDGSTVAQNYLRRRVVSIVNISNDSEKVIFDAEATNNDYSPGYAVFDDPTSITRRLELEKMSIEKRGDQFVISFPKGEAVQGV